MKHINKKYCLVMLLVLIVVFSVVALPASAVTVTGVDGVEVTVDSKGSISESSGTVTATVKGSFTTRKTTVVTVTNTSGNTAKISFDYNATSFSTESDVDGFTLSDTSSGTYEAPLTAGATITFELVSPRWGTSSNTGSVTLSNFKVETAAANPNVTVSYNSLGSVTVAGDAVASGNSVSVSSATGATFAATPVSGAVFVGWVNTGDSSVVSTSASFTYIPTADASLKAVFASASAEPCFWASDKAYLFDSFSAALSHASSASNKVIVLAADGTLPEGDYTIPSGVTLLIPYDDANTLCTTEPTCDADSYEKPSVYRTLTMANGANITVNGAISLSAAQSSKYGYNGMPSGPLPFIKMNSGSTITVKNGGVLYAWGYITGSGSVSVESGGAVYECFQIADYRGGDATNSMVSYADTYGVFPFNQYYLQNIEVPMTLYAGAKETGYTSVQVTIAGAQHSDVPFIGTSGSMFVIDSGYVVKDYVEGTGRTNIEIHGDISVSTISMSIKVSIFGTVDIESSKYSLPIPNHFTVSVESGKINLAQSMAFLPGSELTIKQGASCTLGSGKKIYVYDLDQWLYNSGANGYSGTSNKPYVQLKYVPGGDGTTGRLKDAQIQIDGTVDASVGSVYVTAGGAKIFSTGTGVVKVASTTDAVAYQVITDNTDISSWPKIAMQPAILQDADGTDVATKEKADTYTYYASTGKWCPPGHRYESVVTDPTCTTAGYTTHTCIACGYSYQDSNIDALGHTWGEDGTCTVCGLIQIAGTSVTAGDSLDIYFYVDATLVSDGCKAVITRTRMVKDPSGAYSEESTESAEIPYDEWTKSGSYLRFCYKGIAAKEMTDPVSVTIYDASGKQISTTVTESIEGYALRSLEKHSDAKLYAALVDMLYYGAAAQNYFGYKTTDLATDGLTDVQKAYATESVAYTNITTATNTTYTLAGANVIAESNLYFTFYFDGITDVTNMSAVITYTDHYGDAHTQNIAGSDFSSNSGYYGPRVTGIAVADGNTPITCRLMKDGEIVETVTSSVTSYAVATVDKNKETDPVLTELCNYLMKFIYSAHTYFHAG